MELETKELVGGSGILAAVGFFSKWAWDRFWKSKDGAKATVNATLMDHANRLGAIERKVDGAEIRETERQHKLGALEMRVGGLDGKLEGLQNFWRQQFERMEERIDKRLEALETRLSAALTEHQHRVHERLNAIAGEQLKSINDMVNRLVEKRAERVIQQQEGERSQS